MSQMSGFKVSSVDSCYENGDSCYGEPETLLCTFMPIPRCVVLRRLQIYSIHKLLYFPTKIQAKKFCVHKNSQQFL